MRKISRREAVKSALGVGVAGLASGTIIGSVAGDSQNPKQKAMNHLMNSRVLMGESKDASTQSESDKLESQAQEQRSIAEEILSTNGIVHTEEKQKLNSVYNAEPETGDIPVDTDDRYQSPDGNANTAIWMDTFYGGGDLYTANVSWRLAEVSDAFNIDNVCPPDGCSIYWNDNYWNAESIGRSNFKWTESRGEGAGDGNVSYDQWDTADGGVLAKVDVPEANGTDGQNGKYYGGFATDLIAVNSNSTNYPFKGRYKHTWLFGTSCTGNEYGLTLSAGVISITGGSVKQWSMSGQAYP